MSDFNCLGLSVFSAYISRNNVGSDLKVSALCVYIFVCVCAFVYIYIYIYIYNMLIYIYIYIYITAQECYELHWTNPGYSISRNSSCTAIYKIIQIKQTRDPGHCWRSKDALISDVFLRPPHSDEQLLDDKQEPINNSSRRTQDIVYKTCREREGVREIHASSVTMIIYIYVYIYISEGRSKSYKTHPETRAMAEHFC